MSEQSSTRGLGVVRLVNNGIRVLGDVGDVRTLKNNGIDPSTVVEIVGDLYMTPHDLPLYPRLRSVGKSLNVVTSIVERDDPLDVQLKSLEHVGGSFRLNFYGTNKDTVAFPKLTSVQQSFALHKGSEVASFPELSLVGETLSLTKHSASLPLILPKLIGAGLIRESLGLNSDQLMIVAPQLKVVKQPIRCVAEVPDGVTVIPDHQRFIEAWQKFHEVLKSHHQSIKSATADLDDEGATSCYGMTMGL